MEKIKDIENKISKLLEGKSDNQKEVQALEESTEKQIEAIKKKMEAAKESSDLKAYQAAMKELKAAESERDINQAIKDDFESPLLSEAEYNEYCAAIFAEMDKETAAAKKQLAKLSESMRDIGADLLEKTEHCNEVLKVLQNDVYKNADRERTRYGMYIGNQKEYKESYSAINWAKAGINHYQYGQYTNQAE